MDAPGTVREREAMAADLDRQLADAVVGTVPGLVGMIADRNGVLHESAAGVREAGGAQPMTGDTVMLIASMTKLVTTIAAMQLVEAGMLDLDAPVAPILPELASPVVLEGFDADGAPILSPARRAITLRHLLTHMAGIGYDFMYPALLRARGPGGSPPPTSLASLEGPLAAQPGEQWIYGYGVDWAGIAVERCSGLTLDRYFAERIFAPLGMPDTGFAPAEDARGRLASVHLRDAGTGATVVIPSPAGAPEDWAFHSGGGGLYSTPRDYIRLLRSLLRGGELDGKRILRAETVATMWDNQVADPAAGRLGTANPVIALPYDPLPGQPGGWSLLGVHNAAPLESGRRAGSASWGGIAGTFFWLDRDADLCGVLFAQMFPFADPALAEVQRGFERAAYSLSRRTIA